MSSGSAPAPDEQFCTACGAVIKKQAEICTECGVPNNGHTHSGSSGTTGTQFCEACGEQIRPETELCPSCGVRQKPTGSSGSDTSDVILYVVGGFLVLAGVGSITDPEGSIVFAWLVGIFLIGLGLVALPAVRERVERSHPVTTFGTINSVETAPVRNYDGNCTVCHGPVEDGTRREYAEEFVCFGVALSTGPSGTNVYCETCARTEIHGVTAGPHGTAGESTVQPAGDSSVAETATSDGDSTGSRTPERSEE